MTEEGFEEGEIVLIKGAVGHYVRPYKVLRYNTPNNMPINVFVVYSVLVGSADDRPLHPTLRYSLYRCAERRTDGFHGRVPSGIEYYEIPTKFVIKISPLEALAWVEEEASMEERCKRIDPPHLRSMR